MSLIEVLQELDWFWTIQVELYLLKSKLSHLFPSHEEDRRRIGEISPRTFSKKKKISTDQ